MCGIGGMITFDKLTSDSYTYLKSLMSKLHVRLEDRGTQASGICSVTDSNIKIYKDGTRAYNLVRRAEYDKIFTADAKVILLHTRAATHGNINNNVNNHPHLSDEGNVLIHNGVIHNQAELKKQYDLLTNGECDSEVLLKLIETIGFNSAVKKARGSIAVGYYDKINNKLILYRNDGNPLWVIYLKQHNAFVFASTLSILTKAIYDVDERHISFNDITFKHILGNIYYRKLSEGDKLIFDLTNKKLTQEKVKSETDEPFKQWYFNKDWEV